MEFSSRLRFFDVRHNLDSVLALAWIDVQLKLTLHGTSNPRSFMWDRVERFCKQLMHSRTAGDSKVSLILGLRG